MYEISVGVGACVRAGTRADVMWVVESDVPGGAAGALAFTAGGGRIGGLLGGALDDQAAGLVAGGTTGRLLDLEVDPLGALVSDVPAGTRVRCLLAPAADFPEGFWDGLWAGRPVCLAATLDGDRIVSLRAYGEDEVAALGEEAARLFSRGATASLVEADRVVTALWPVPRLALVGGGPVLDAVERAAQPLGWQVLRFPGAGEAAPVLLGLGGLDVVLVASHDLGAAGSALAAALSGNAGYVGALGSPRMHDARLDWLASRGVAGLERIHGPAGLDLGARRPAEVAVAILAEAMLVRSGRTGRPLRDVAPD
ncbi:XdhC family protein [Nocardioides sp. YIM 152588]|uniref:XdhC family protein n=1 Tax=Nocardioides sp. YIM 152588 TaxID=3158259 RepID=UPI0032E43B58